MVFVMEREPIPMTNEAPPVEPERTGLYPVAAQQQVLAALERDAAAGLHLLCVTGPPGSGKSALLRALQQGYKPGQVGFMETPTPGRLLVEVARAWRLNAMDDDASFLRRQLVMRLAMAARHHKPIIQIVDDADSLSSDDIDLLIHFFPPGHATLVLAGAADPEAWLADCMSPSARVHFDRVYRLDPLSEEETSGFIRHLLHRSAAPLERLQPDAIALIHQQSGALPGRIEQYLGEALARAGDEAREGPATTGPAVAPAAGPEHRIEHPPEPASLEDLAPSMPVEDSGVDVMAAPVRIPADRQAPAGSTPGSDALARREHRLRRSARIWRSLALLASAALVAVLTRDAWIGHIPLDHPWSRGLVERFLAPVASVPPAPEPGEPPASHRPARAAGAEAPDEAVRQGGGAVPSSPSPQAASDAPPPAPVAATRPGDESPAAVVPEGTATAASAAEPAATQATPPEPVPAESAVAEPEAAEAVTPEPATPEPATPEPVAPEPVAPEPVAPEPVAPEPAAAEATATEPAAPRAATEPPPLSPAQRAEIARLYAVRADYEWRKGDLEAAALSIRNGLSTDPGNKELLDMGARLLEEMRGR